MPKTELIESLRTIDMLLRLAAIGETKALIDAHQRVDKMIKELLNA